MDPRFKRLLRMILGGVVLGLLGVVAGNLLFPDSTPKLIEGLDPDFRQASIQLTQRVRTRFPTGSSESVVASTLAADGFTINSANHTASWQHRGFRCVDIARVWWRAERGRLVTIEGVRNAVCP